MAEKDIALNRKNLGTLPVIPLRNILLAPNTITPLLVGRELSIHAAETALVSNKQIICVTQKYETVTDENPKSKDLYRFGTICTILQIMKLPDGNMRLLVEGEKRVVIEKYRRKKNYLSANYVVKDKVLSENELESEALLRSFRKAFKSYVNLNKAIPEEAMIPLTDAENADEFFYYALSNIQLDVSKKQHLFELDDLFESISQLYKIVIEEIQILKLEYKIDGTVKSKLNKLQREYYLNEQLKAIHKELGITKEDKTELYSSNFSHMVLFDTQTKLFTLELEEQDLILTELPYKRMLEQLAHISCDVDEILPSTIMIVLTSYLPKMRLESVDQEYDMMILWNMKRPTIKREFNI